MFESDSSVASGNGRWGAAVPLIMNGMRVTDMIAAVAVVGVTGATVVNLRRVRGPTGVDVFTSGISLGASFWARNGVLSPTAGMLETGDVLYPDVRGVHTGTAPLGLSVTITVQ